MQGPGGVNWYVGVARAFDHGPEVVGRPTDLSEDCLYLNVWTSSPDPDAKQPVMVFVHGGSNAGGWSYEPNYMGTRLAEKGVVVVTVAYRLGPFGFFAHPALKDAENAPLANFGLLDIRRAFQWVRDHIAAFGGDPNRITAFGESAGAFDLVDLLSVDMAAGKTSESLFRRLISQSVGGSLVNRQTLDQEQATGVMLTKMLGLEPDATEDAIRALAAEDLLQAVAKLPPGHYFDAVIDGRTLTQAPVDSFIQANTSDIDIMAGTNADEWYMYIDEDITESGLLDWISENTTADQAELLAEVADEPDVRRKLDQLRTARNMLCPSRFLAEKVSHGGGRGWVYYFTRQRPGPGGEKLGAYHGTELPYVFGMHDDWMPTEAPDIELTEVVMDYWVQFARTGNPNQEGRADWPMYTPQNPGVMELGTQVGATAPSAVGLCDLLGPRRQESRAEKT
jgi:para-nitrobenzyl esterase